MSSPSSTPAAWWRVLAVLLGLLLLLAAYYWVHKPFDLSLALRLGGTLLDIGAVAVLFGVGGGLGRLSLSRLDWTLPSRAERLALETLVGLAGVSVAALALGMAGQFRGVALWGPLIVVLLLARHGLAAWLRDLRALFTRVPLPDAWSKLYALGAVLLLALALVQALAPPVAWDGMNYHLVAPSRYLADGQIRAAADNFFFGFPQLVEVLFGVAISAFGRDTTAALVHFGFGAFGLLALAGLVQRHTRAAGGWLAVILPLSAASFWLLLAWPYVDLAAFAYGAAALVVAVVWRGRRSVGWLALLGVLLGCAAGVKYTAGLLTVGIAFYVVVLARGGAWRALGIVGAAALVAFAPWLLKGLFLYGNPVYPFLFGGLGWDAERAVTFSTGGRGLVAAGELWQAALLPLAATVLGVEKGAGFAFTAGPWLLTAPLLLLIPGWPWLGASARRLALDCALIGLPLLAVWAGLAAFTEIGAQTRLMAAALPVAVAAGAVALDGLSDWPRKPIFLAFIVRVVLVGTLLLGVLEAARVTLNGGALAYSLGLTDRTAYEDVHLGAYAGAMRALDTLPAGSRVLFLWEPRTYGCPAVLMCRGDVLLDTWARAVNATDSPGAALAVLQADADYVLVWQAGLNAALEDGHFGPANRQFAAVEAALTPVWTDGILYTIYAGGMAAGQ